MFDNLGTVIAVATSKDDKPAPTLAARTITDPMRSGRIPVGLVTSAVRKLAADAPSGSMHSTWS